MKRNQLAAVLTLIGLGMIPVMAETNIRWADRHHNFGTFNEDLGNVTCTFTGVNEGNDTVYVTATRSTCGCTTPTVNSRTIAPGDTLKVNVTYNAERRPGPFDKRITIVCGDAGQEILTIAGKVKGSASSLAVNFPQQGPHFRLQNAFVGIGNIIKGHTGSGSLFGINDQDFTITPVIEGVPPYVTTICYPDSSQEGENLLISLTVDTNHPEIPYGLNVDSIKLSIKEFPDDKMTIPLTYIVSEDFSKLTKEERASAPFMGVETRSIDFGRIDLGKTKKLEKKFNVTNSGESPLILRRVYTYDPCITVKTDKNEIAAGKSATITVTVDPARLKGIDMLNGRITLISNSPDNPTENVRVVGETVDSSTK